MRYKLPKLILLIFALHLIGTGCNNKVNTITIKNPVESETHYNVEFIIPPSELNQYTKGVLIGQTVYYYTNMMTNKSILYSQSIDNDEFKEVPLQLKDGEIINSLQTSKDGFLIIMAKESLKTTFLQKYDPYWNLIAETEITKDCRVPSSFLLKEDKNGKILWNDYFTLQIYNEDLTEDFTLEISGSMDIEVTADGLFEISCIEDNTNTGSDFPPITMYDLDQQKKKLIKQYNLFIPWSGNLQYGYHADTYFIDHSNGLCRFDSEDHTLTRLVGLSDIGVGYLNPQGILTGESETIVLLTLKVNGGDMSSEDYYGGLEIVKLTPSEETDQTKKELTLASHSSGQALQEFISRFNRENKEYSVKLLDYSGDEGIDRLNADIISGNVPDLMDTDSLPIDTYINKGLLVDLNTFLQEDDELSEDLLVDPIYKGLCRDGKLYEMIASFRIHSWIGKKSILGEVGEFNLQKLDQVIGSMDLDVPVILEGDPSPMEFMRMFCFIGSQQFIDFKEGICRFDGSDFYDILEFVKKNGKEDFSSDMNPTELVVNNQSLLFSNELAGTPYMWMDIFGKLFENNMAFYGFPTDKGNPPVFIPQSSLAITSVCEDKDAAWGFLRGLLSQDYQLGILDGFPFRKDALEQLLRESQYTETTTEDGRTVNPIEGEIPIGKYLVEFGPLSDEEVELCHNLIYSATNRIQMDKSIHRIILEECESYFKNTKSTEKTASTIQQRVQTLLDERK